MKILIKCNYCKKNFFKAKCHIKRNKNHFCSIKCKSFWQKENHKGELNSFYNKHHTEETKKLISLKNLGKIRKNISEALKGRNLKERSHKLNCSCCICKAKRGETAGINNPNYGNHKLVGKNHPNYKDGRTSLWLLIRNSSEYKNWRISVFEKDGYTCQKCSDNKGGNLEAHHIKPFSIILSEFIKQYYSLSPIDDKEELLTLSITYKDFWNIDNGITLCKQCHYKEKKKTLDKINDINVSFKETLS